MPADRIGHDALRMTGIALDGGQRKTAAVPTTKPEDDAVRQSGSLVSVLGVLAILAVGAAGLFILNSSISSRLRDWGAGLEDDRGRELVAARARIAELEAQLAAGGPAQSASEAKLLASLDEANARVSALENELASLKKAPPAPPPAVDFTMHEPAITIARGLGFSITTGEIFRSGAGNRRPPRIMPLPSIEDCASHCMANVNACDAFDFQIGSMTCRWFAREPVGRNSTERAADGLFGIRQQIAR